MLGKGDIPTILFEDFSQIAHRIATIIDDAMSKAERSIDVEIHGAMNMPRGFFLISSKRAGISDRNASVTARRSAIITP